MRVAHPIVLREDVRRKLEQQARGRSTAARVVMRSRIILLASEGLQNKQIAGKLQVAPRMVTLWRARFLELGMEGLLKDAPRPGRTPSISAEVTAALIAKTTQSTPANATQWSTRTMAKEMSISKASVSRIWRANGLKPHRVESFKVSNDPNFADKLEAIVGLYLNPPEHALVLSVDEKSQIQALDRTQPGLPLKKGRGQTMTHDYKRNGTTTLFAALDTATGEIYGLCQQKHRHQEWLRFLRMIDQTIPADKDIYLICDAQVVRDDLSRKMMTAQDADRTRIARELHDDIGQSLAVLKIQMLRAGQPVSGHPEMTHASLRDLSGKLEKIIDKVGRLSHNLHSSELELLGLVVAVKSHCRECSEQLGISVHCSCDHLQEKVDSVIALAFLRVLQEGLHNAVKYSGAKSIRVRLTGSDRDLSLEIYDDGVGFDVETAKLAAGLGLISMRERIHLIGGEFQIWSRSGQGTRITAHAPVIDRTL